MGPHPGPEGKEVINPFQLNDSPLHPTPPRPLSSTTDTKMTGETLLLLLLLLLRPPNKREMHSDVGKIILL